jgi:hypothetical protein
MARQMLLRPTKCDKALIDIDIDGEKSELLEDSLCRRRTCRGPYGRSGSLLYHQHLALRTEILLRRHLSNESTLLVHIRGLADDPLGQHAELA